MKYTNLRHILLLFFCFLFPITDMSAQINMSLYESTSNVRVDLEVRDKETEETVSFATVYLIPEGDTTIVDFCLSDKEGKVRFKEVPSGDYEVNIELLGYLPYKKVHKLRNWRVDLGRIFLEVNPEYLESARVSAAANPIRIVKDTVEFTASAFRVGQNAMLEDLLKKMPGMEVEDGKVKLNGQPVDRITVGGKTFFFDDQSASLKNLPARLVEKIKVIDKDKDDVAFAGGGISQDDKEKVLDVELKKEFQKGWFGNVAAAAGASINSDKDNELMEKSSPIYNGSGMVSGYNEKDQLVLLGGGENVSERNYGMDYNTGLSSDMENAYAQMGGLVGSVNGGVNWNTQRMKGLEMASSVKYDHSHKNSRRKSYRTAFQQDRPDLQTNSASEGTGSEDGVNFSLELKNADRKKYYLGLQPYINYQQNHTEQNSISETFAALQDGTDKENLNRNGVSNNGRTALLSNGLHAGFGVTDMGKKERSVSLGLDYRSSRGKGSSHEVTNMSGTSRALRYEMDQYSHVLQGRLFYTEPFAEKFYLAAGIHSVYRTYGKTKDAFNPEGMKNDYYSSFSGNTYLQETGSLYFSYKHKDMQASVGTNLMVTENVIRTTSLGKETETGKDKWDWKVSPSLSFSTRAEGHRFNFYYNGWTAPVPAEQLVPALDFRNPLQISTGNVYLKPYFLNQLYLNYAYNNKKTFTYLGLDFHGDLTLNGISNAVWFDKEGVRYAVPVNVRRPQANTSVNLSFNQPFGKEKQFSAAVYVGLNLSKSDSYQASGILEGLNMDEFDYNHFMSSFWGEASGDRFYAGESGFLLSRTSYSSSWGSLNFRYNGELLGVSLKQNFGHHLSRYSLMPENGTSTWNLNSSIYFELHPGKEWECTTDAGYSWYIGYPEGYGEPQFLWNMKISKSVKALTFILAGVDLLNQCRNFSHNVSQEYVEDSYVNAFGRYLTFGIAWNFGKRGAEQNNNVREALYRMR